MTQKYITKWDRYTSRTRLKYWNKFLQTGTRGQVPADYTPDKDQFLYDQIPQDEKDRMDAQELRRASITQAEKDERLRAQAKGRARRAEALRDKNANEVDDHQVAAHRRAYVETQKVILKEQKKVLTKELELELKDKRVLIAAFKALKTKCEQNVKRLQAQMERSTLALKKKLNNMVPVELSIDADKSEEVMAEEQRKWERQEEARYAMLLVEELDGWDLESLKSLRLGLSDIGSSNAIQLGRLLDQLIDLQASGELAELQEDAAT